MYEHVTSRAVTIRHAEDAACQIDEAFRTALTTRKPVYIEVPLALQHLRCHARNRYNLVFLLPVIYLCSMRQRNMQLQY